MQEGTVVSDKLNPGEAGQRRPPPPIKCEHCGAVAIPMTILDIREGKNFRLIRCLGCDKLSWKNRCKAASVNDLPAAQHRCPRSASESAAPRRPAIFGP